MAESWAGFGSAIASFLFLYAMVKDHIPFQLSDYLATFSRKVLSFINPYDQITVSEYHGEYMHRDELYAAAQVYLSDSCSFRARKLKAEVGQESDKPLVTIDDYEEVTDTFRGVKIWWYACMRLPNSKTISFYGSDEERKYYRLTFHKRNRKLIEGEYLNHILREGRDMKIRRRQRKLFTNSPSRNWYGYRSSSSWSHVAFEHPATFETLAMDPEKKREIIDDLVTFREGKEYYKKIGKAWKRGYLLFGPPGTGNSSMIAAIANFLEYDVYDLELTTVKTNTELRKIFIETTGKSIIVIEDIDCSVDLTGKRKEKKKEKDDEEKEKKPPGMEEKDENSKLTLSGLLNFIDGLWSACGGERIVIFTTNHLEKLDPALIRRGRMDMHIEMSYCSFEAFKVLAKNYLGVAKHDLFDTIQTLLSEVNISPADVAEGLMLKKSRNKDVGACLENLIRVIEAAKEEAKRKAQEELAAKEKENEESTVENKASDIEDNNSKKELASE
ncbi:P-loop containing nucleoside triphosphate hydrolases superfamily protein [Rhynchospora pubera]|uniref:P-loop containing nucleoside triphosphate hydrolases superfamily protein n=1 Tax=Rhynchospora pubera TaxID=906938 RepID=A0AAV8DNS8_9POAL|nr:P-loop containing nucleoside triphosphate hydrolases superfamily protein [Rhynchospora pubera]